MIDYSTYKLLHLAGLILLYLSLGGALLARSGTGEKPARIAMMLHGIGLLLMLIAGFGMLARLQITWPWPTYIFAKVGIWVLLGALPPLVRRGIVPVKLGWVLAAGLGVLAAWFVLFGKTL